MYVSDWLSVSVSLSMGKLWGATGAALLWTITQCLLSAPNISASSRKNSWLSTWTSKRLILNFKTVDGTKFDRPCSLKLEKVTKKIMQFFNFIALLLYSYISCLPSETITPWQLPQPGILQPACVASLGVLHGESGPAKEIWLNTAESPNWQSITTISTKNQLIDWIFICQDQPSGATTLQYSLNACSMWSVCCK